MNALGASEFLSPPSVGRIFSAERAVRLGDVDPAGSLRLDATARYLQDVATDDAADCGLDGRFGWVVRRTMIDVATPAQLEERLDIATFCTGIGRSWAERRTSITGVAGARVEAVSLWIQVDAQTGRPARLTDQFRAIYGTACGDRVVSARLSLDGLETGADDADEAADVAAAAWTVRRADLDPFDHVNNAANWTMVEELLTVGGRRRGRAEMEYLAPVRHDERLTLQHRAAPGDAEGFAAWLTSDIANVHTAMRWTPT